MLYFLRYYWYSFLRICRTAYNQIIFKLGERERLLNENKNLKQLLSKAEDRSFAEYFNANTFLSTATGLELQFKGKELVKIMAACFWELVKDADNFIICDVNNHLGDCVKVIICKPGKLTPQEKLRSQEAEIKALKSKLSKYESIS